MFKDKDMSLQGNIRISTFNQIQIEIKNNNFTSDIIKEDKKETKTELC